MIDIEGSIVTADAMSCKKAICAKITDRRADFVIGLKENQPSLYDDVRLYFTDFENETKKTETFEKGHGRIEKREYFLEVNIDWLSHKPLWSGLTAIGAVKSAVCENGEVRTETRYFITSKVTGSCFW